MDFQVRQGMQRRTRRSILRFDPRGLLAFQGKVERSALGGDGLLQDSRVGSRVLRRKLLRGPDDCGRLARGEQRAIGFGKAANRDFAGALTACRTTRHALELVSSVLLGRAGEGRGGIPSQEDDIGARERPSVERDRAFDGQSLDFRRRT